MRINKIVFSLIFLTVTAFVYYKVASNKKEIDKKKKSTSKILYVPVDTVFNRLYSIDYQSYGHVQSNEELDIAFEIQGKLLKGAKDLNPGSKFNFNELLYSIDQQEAFYQYTARKEQLSNLLISCLAEIEIDFPDQLKKWNTFLNNLNPNALIPDFPNFNNEKEKKFITFKGIYSEYLNIKSIELRLEKYFYYAPFNGIVTAVYNKPFSIINPGVRIARISNTNKMEVKVPVLLSMLSRVKKSNSIIFTNSNGEKVGEGSFLRQDSQIDQNTQSINLFYEIKGNVKENLILGQFLNVTFHNSTNIDCYRIPENAINKNSVCVLQNGNIVQQNVNIIASSDDSLFVVGLKNGSAFILEKVSPNKEITYKGINKN